MSQSTQLAAAPLSSLVSFRNVQPDTVRASFPLCFPDQLQKDSDGRIDLDDPANQKILVSPAAEDGAKWLTAQGFKHFAQKQYRRELSALNQAKVVVADGDNDDAKAHPVKRRTSFSKAHGQSEAEEKGSDPAEAVASKPAFVLASAHANDEGGASIMMKSAQSSAQPLLEKRVYVHPVLASEAPGLALALSEAGAMTGIGNDLKLELEAQVVHKGGKCLLQFTIPVLGTYSKEMPFFLPEGKVMLRGELIVIFYIPTGARLSVWLNGQQVWDFKIGL